MRRRSIRRCEARDPALRLDRISGGLLALRSSVKDVIWFDPITQTETAGRKRPAVVA
jgi:hypothetical protein